MLALKEIWTLIQKVQIHKHYMTDYILVEILNWHQIQTSRSFYLLQPYGQSTFVVKELTTPGLHHPKNVF